MGSNCISAAGMTIAMPSGEVCVVAESAKQCSVLFVNPGAARTPHRVMLEGIGFRVTEARDWPEDDRAVLDYEVVIVRVRSPESAPMLAARLRAKPRFGRRVLIALVPASVSLKDRHSARASGFDEVLTDCCDGRQLVARILRRLRTRPEYHCFLPPDHRRSPAA
jgi:DNA-binding response OmpR family regulator